MSNKNLETRILNRLVFFSIFIIIVYFVVHTIHSIVASIPFTFIDNFYVIIVLLFYSSYYLLTYYKISFSIIKTYAYVIFIASTTASFFTSGGFGPITSLDLLVGFSVGLLIFPNPFMRKIIILLYGLIIMGLLLVQQYSASSFHQIEIVSPVITLTIGLITRFLLAYNLFIVIIDEYSREHSMVLATNEKIENLNTKLKTTNQDLEKSNNTLSETIVELKETQMKLLQSEKMASVGILTAGVSHEINNPLNYLMGAYTGFMQFFNDDAPEYKEQVDLLLTSMKSGIDKATKIVQGLNQFSRDNTTINEDCKINSILDNCLTMLYNQYKHVIDIEKNYNVNIPIIKGSVGRLHQAFLNILSNAIQSINKKGVIYISSDIVNDTVVITIKDTGCGIEPENLNRIFDPFFTTKEPGKGTGLGLSITYTIIEEHDGKIHVESESNFGTTVKVILPIN